MLPPAIPTTANRRQRLSHSPQPLLELSRWLMCFGKQSQLIRPYKLVPWLNGSGGDARLVKGVPQCTQNLNGGGSSKLHYGQRGRMAMPHSLQYFTLSGVSNPQPGQRVGLLLRVGAQHHITRQGGRALGALLTYLRRITRLYSWCGSLSSKNSR